MDRLIGYRIDDEMPSGWRLTLKIAWAIGIMAVAALMIAITQRDPLPRRGTIRILSTLDEFTRDAGLDTPNTIPAFLELSGDVGVLGPSADPDEPVRAIDEEQLREGFCSPSLVRHIRHEYPGFYDAWPDDKLARLVLEKYPEWHDRRCSLSYKLDATAVGVIKYQLKPRTFVMAAAMWTLTALVTLAFAVGAANLYYRVLVARLAA